MLIFSITRDYQQVIKITINSCCNIIQKSSNVHGYIAFIKNNQSNWNICAVHLAMWELKKIGKKKFSILIITNEKIVNRFRIEQKLRKFVLERAQKSQNIKRNSSYEYTGCCGKLKKTFFAGECENFFFSSHRSQH